MILVKPSFEILSMPLPSQILKSIERAGRTCYKSEHRITDSTAGGFVKGIIQSGHHSVLEHENISVKIICDRGVTHEIVRHRLVAYSQESTRYCNYKGGVTFVIPPWINVDSTEFIIEDGQILGHKLDYSPTAAWLDSMLAAERWHKELISAGDWSPQQAHSVLPNSLKTEIVMTANIREWRHILKLRTSKAAHPQMRETMIPILAEFSKLIPVLFDDIG